ncbi:hypothetical protein HN011_012032 [Eciton burchellii]|nr:hypothetical protein HN011_012032 [Eciton burchellii]
MNPISEIDQPVTKRLKSKDGYIEMSHEEENVTEEISFDQAQKDDKSLMANNDEISEIIDSDDESFTFPPDKDISDMLNGVQYSGYFPTVTDRYFTPYYKVNVQSPGDDICIRIHSNRICMLSLAPSHIILQNDKEIKKVDFRISDKVDRSLNKVSGKGKHGAQPLQANSNICTISCFDGQAYVIKCCVIGKLVEINEMLLENPQLVREPPHKGGYLAIILPNIKLLENLKQSLLTHEQYVELVKEREKKQECIE